MSAQNLDEEEEQKPSKGAISRKRKLSDREDSVPVKQGAKFVDKYRSELIQKVHMVMPVMEELLSQGLLDGETRLQIITSKSDEEKMIELYKAMDAGGDKVKYAFYSELKDYEPHLVQDLDADLREEFEDDVIHQYKFSIIENCKFVTEYNPPSDERVDLAARYTEPVIIQRSKQQNEKYCQYAGSSHTSGTKTSSQLLSNDKNPSVSIDQLFSPNSDGNTPKTVILSGDSGTGKSFLLQKIMLDWASGELYSENFDVIFILNCEELKCISEEMSLNELLSWSCSLKSDQISQILKFTPEKILFLVDGMDENVFLLPTTSNTVQPMDTLRNLLRGVLLPESFVLVSTRSIADDAVMKIVKGPQRLTEIVGFSERGVQEYFHKFFQDEQLSMKIYKCLKTNESLLTTCSVPLMCWMVCFCLKKHFTDYEHVLTKLETTTSIYVHFVSTLLEHHGQSQSVLTMLRSLGQLAERGIQNQQVLFKEKSVAETGLDAAMCLFLYEDIRKDKQEPLFRFMHSNFQEFFTALYYVLLDKKKLCCKVSELFNLTKSKKRISRPSLEIRSNPIPSVMMFLSGLLNMKVSSSLFRKIKWTVPHIIKLKKDLQEIIFTMKKQHGCELFALHCLYELRDNVLMKRALADWKSKDLSNISLRSTDCWVLLYCLRLCPHIRELNLMNSDLTADKLRILQQRLCMCETLRLTVDILSEVGNSIKMFAESKILRKLEVQEDKYSGESPRWSLDLSVTYECLLLCVRNLENNSSFLKTRLTCPHSEISNFDWTIFLQRVEKSGMFLKNSSGCDHVSLLLSSFHSVGIKNLDLKVFSLNKSWASGIISLVQTCTSLQQLSVSVTGLLLEEGLELLYKSLTDTHCTVTIKGRKCSKSTDQCKEEDWSHSCNEKKTFNFKPKVLEEPTISEPKLSALDFHLFPVCQSCVHIVDCDQWVQVEPSVCTDEGGSKFSIRTPAGRFECSRTRMRWVCAGDVTLQYCAVDGHLLNAELERLQCERIGPVIDVTVISGKLEEAHLPHFACLAESDPSLKDAVKLLSKRNEGISLQPVELTRYHAKILQPSFSLKTIIISLFKHWEEHCNLLLYMRCKDPLILHVYFFPVNDTLLKEKVEQNEKSSHLISHPRPDRPFRMKTPHLLEVPGASVHPVEGISFRTDIDPNFFEIMQHQHGDVQMNLVREEDKESVWTSTIWKAKLALLNQRLTTQINKNDHEEEKQKPPKETQFVDRNFAALIQRVTSVMAIADELQNKDMIHYETYKTIRAEKNNLEKMRNLFEALEAGGDRVKHEFYYALKRHERYIFEDLGGDVTTETEETTTVN